MATQSYRCLNRYKCSNTVSADSRLGRCDACLQEYCLDCLTEKIHCVCNEILQYNGFPLDRIPCYGVPIPVKYCDYCSNPYPAWQTECPRLC